MSNGSNYITGRGEQSKTFVIYRVGCGVMEQHQVCAGSTGSGVAMVTTDALQEVIPWTTHHLGKEMRMEGGNYQVQQTVPAVYADNKEKETSPAPRKTELKKKKNAFILYPFVKERLSTHLLI